MSFSLKTYPVEISDLTTERPIFLELMGETNPLLDESFSEVVRTAKDPDTVPVYEYLWTLGHAEGFDHGKAPSWSKVMPWLRPPPSAVSGKGVRVHLDFGGMNGWRISEPIGTLKFMSPAPKLKGKAGAEIAQKLQAASQMTALVPGGAAPSKWIEAVGKLEATCLPQEGDKGWTIARSTRIFGNELRQRITWTIPQKMFEVMGGLLAGGLAVTFIDSPIAPDADTDPKVKARAGMPSGSIFLSAEFNHWANQAEGWRRWLPTSPRRVTMMVPPNKVIAANSESASPPEPDFVVLPLRFASTSDGRRTETSVDPKE